MKRTLFILAAVLALVSCKSTKALLPNVSGKAGEIIVVIDKNDWEGNLGTKVRDLLACDCPFLAQREPLYSLVNVPPGGFGDLFKVHRNIVYFNLNPQVDSSAVRYRSDVWAAPQCLVQINAPTSERAAELLTENGSKIVSFIEQAERDR